MALKGKLISEMSADSRAVYDLLSRAAVGETVTYAALHELTGRDVQGKDRYVISTATRACLRDGKAFGTIRGVGLRALNDVEIVTDASAAIPRIRHLAKRAARKITAIADYASMPRDTQIKHNSFLSIFGAISHMATNRSISQIETKVSEANQSLSLVKTLEIFK